MGKVLPKTIDKKFKDAYGRYWFMTMVNALRDENVQVSGILFILDFSDFPIRALSMFSPSETHDIMKYQVSRPRNLGMSVTTKFSRKCDDFQTFFCFMHKKQKGTHFFKFTNF